MVKIDQIQNKIILGEACQNLETFPDKSIDLVVTSPPYDDLRDYTGDKSWNLDIFHKIAIQLKRVLVDGGVIVWVVGDKVKQGSKSLTSFKHALYFQELGLNIYDVIIYEKAGSGPPHKNRYFNTFEYMFVISKGFPKTVNLLKDKKNNWGGHKTYGNITRREKDGSLVNKGSKVINEYGIRTNIWRYNNGKGFSTTDLTAHEHPAIFPEKLVEDHIMTWSNENDIVLDPFLGSGTTAIVANKLNRNWIGIEISKDYCDLAKRRIGRTQVIKYDKRKKLYSEFEI
jgi:site-specific DNA-methyltransferase (adenine-specific)